ncbi:hypothetical protein BJ996_000092 [Streptomyces phaeogriseichromatogenes]|nr:hypothetical protein [Streptomyces murinus]
MSRLKVRSMAHRRGMTTKLVGNARFESTD